MSIRKIEIINEDHIRVSELCTVNSLIQTSNELYYEGHISDALYYERKAKDAKKAGKKILWDSVFLGTVRDLCDKEWTAFVRASRAGVKTAYACVY